MSITRRDFLNGVALTIGAVGIGGLSACGENNAPPTNKNEPTNATPTATAPEPNYPPSKLGMRGNHDGSFEVAHDLSWKKTQYDLTTATDKGEYDLVVVGAGISGLVSAYEFKKHNPDGKILILDNHDDFGGHAKRQEITFDGGMRITYGGSESFDSPKANFNQDITALMQELGIDYTKFEQFFDQKFNERHGLTNSTFFNKAVFGQSKIINHALEQGDKFKDAIANAPLSDDDRAVLIELVENPKDYLGDMPKPQRESFLSGISYDHFLKTYVKASAGVMNVLQDICLEYWGFGIDHLSAYDAVGEGYPATANLGVAVEEYHSEPYIYHFPDGNASVARLLVKALIPNVSTSTDYEKMSAMEAIVLDKFNYDNLDKDDQLVQLRLNATCVSAKNANNKVELGYSLNNQLYKVTAKHAIMAGNHRLIPHLIPEMGDQTKQAFAKNVKIPLIYAKILVKNWQAFKTLGTRHLYCPKAPYVLTMLDYPVSMGGYECAKNPDEPIIVHLVRIPVPYGTGKDLREACQIGRREVYEKSFADLEKQAIDQLSEIYELANDTLKDKILAVSVHRWSHGYSYEQNILYDSDKDTESTLAQVQKAIGNIHFANSDADWEPYMHGAINQGFRAVREILKASK